MTTIRDLAGKKVLVTGASGFIGSHLCERLQGLGCEVHGITRAKRPDGKDGVTWWQSDLSEPLEVIRLVESILPDIVYHLSSYVNGSRSLDAVMPTFNSNLVTTVNLLVALSKVGCQRVLLIGSMEEPRPDQAGWTSISPYAASKWASSIYGRLFYSLYNLPVVILHVFMVYGPRQTDLKKLIPYVILSLLRNEVPKVSSGSMRTDWIYIEDVIDGLICSAQAAGMEGRTLEIGSGSLLTVRKIVDMLTQLINPKIEAEFGALADRLFEGTRVADTKGTCDLLGWKSKVQIDEGLRRTISWYKEHMSTGMK